MSLDFENCEKRWCKQGMSAANKGKTELKNEDIVNIARSTRA